MLLLLFVTATYNIVTNDVTYAEDISRSVTYMNDALYKLSYRLDRCILRDDIRSMEVAKYEILSKCDGPCSDDVNNEIKNIDNSINNLNKELLLMEKK